MTREIERRGAVNYRETAYRIRKRAGPVKLRQLVIIINAAMGPGAVFGVIISLKWLMARTVRAKRKQARNLFENHNRINKIERKE